MEVKSNRDCGYRSGATWNKDADNCNLLVLPIILTLVVMHINSHTNSYSC